MLIFLLVFIQKPHGLFAEVRDRLEVGVEVRVDPCLDHPDQHAGPHVDEEHKFIRLRVHIRE